MNKKKRKLKQSLLAVILIGLISVVVLMQAGAGAIGYYIFTETSEEQYANMANMIATAGANIIDGDRLDEYLQEGESSADYVAIQNRLRNLADSSGSQVIYVAKVDLSLLKRIYIFDVLGKDSDLDPYPIGYINDASEGFLKSYDGLRKNQHETVNNMYYNNASSGSYTTSLAPVYDSKGALVAVCGVVMPLNSLVSARSNFLRQLLIWAIFISIIVSVGWYELMRRKVVKPLRQLADEAGRFSQERTVRETPISEEIESHSEIGELAHALDEMENNLVTSVTELLYMTAEKNRIGAELNVATKIQENVLPTITESFPGRKEISLSAYMQPAKEVGGDFYDFFFIDEDHFAMVIADVSGKGVPAALFMMISKVLIKTGAMNGNYDPGAILTSVNQKLCENNEIDMFVTTWLGIIELSTGKVVASNAGHEYPVLTGESGDMELLRDKHGFVLGGMPGIKEKNYEFQMKPGDFLYVYTDGVAEAINKEQEQFGTDRLLEALNSDPYVTPERKIKLVNQALEAFVGEEEQFDDTTMLCIRYNGAE